MNTFREIQNWSGTLAHSCCAWLRRENGRVRSLGAIFMIAGAEMGPLCMTLLFSSSPIFRYHYFYLIQITISRAQRRLATEAHYPQKKSEGIEGVGRWCEVRDDENRKKGGNKMNSKISRKITINCSALFRPPRPLLFSAPGPYGRGNREIWREKQFNPWRKKTAALCFV